jgi:hypothetical protein
MLQEVNRRDHCVDVGRRTQNFNLTRLNKVDYSFLDEIQEGIKEDTRRSNAGFGCDFA